MDNAPYNRQTQDAGLPRDDAVKLFPPYSPFLNIAENAFSMWKASFKCQMAEIREQVRYQGTKERQATLVQLGQQSLVAITAQKMAAATRAMVRLMPRLLNAEDVFDNHAWTCFVIKSFWMECDAFELWLTLLKHFLFNVEQFNSHTNLLNAVIESSIACIWVSVTDAFD